MRLVISLLLLVGSGAALAHGEADLFRAQAKTPLQALETAYGESQILALGENNHARFQGWDFVCELLRKVGHDARLKYLAVEADESMADFLRKASREAPTGPPARGGGVHRDGILFTTSVTPGAAS